MPVNILPSYSKHILHLDIKRDCIKGMINEPFDTVFFFGDIVNLKQCLFDGR